MSADVTESDWRRVESHPAAFGILSARRSVQNATLLLAVDYERKRHALFALPTSGTGYRDEMSRGLTVQERNLQIESDPERAFLDVACTDQAGHEAFNLVVSEILERLRGGNDPVSAVRFTISRWRRFWGAALTEGLTAEQLRGLFGELWFLLVWALPHGHQNVAHWSGPTGTRHDFQWPTFAVEVKTTHSIRGHLHHVNGLDQLDLPDNGPLYVFSLRIRDESSGRHSLVLLIERLVQALDADPAMLDLLETRLGQAGYSPAHAARYTEMRFHVVDQRLYLVGGHFPRLSVASFVGGLPVGIARVEYDINLETCPDLCIGRDPVAPGLALEP